VAPAACRRHEHRLLLGRERAAHAVEAVGDVLPGLVSKGRIGKHGHDLGLQRFGPETLVRVDHLRLDAPELLPSQVIQRPPDADRAQPSAEAGFTPETPDRFDNASYVAFAKHEAEQGTR
jgi:hypothetical protein